MNKDGEKTTVGVKLPYSYLYNVELYLRAWYTKGLIQDRVTVAWPRVAYIVK